jgi:hypothetical protein
MTSRNASCSHSEKRLCQKRVPRFFAALRLIAVVFLISASMTIPLQRDAFGGSVINNATTGAAGTTVTISNSSASKLLNANTLRYGWTVYCAGTSGTIAALMMPGDSANNAASPAPSQTVGFPIPANTLVTNQDFPLRGLDALHQRIDAQAQGASSISCYTWEEQ